MKYPDRLSDTPLQLVRWSNKDEMQDEIPRYLSAFTVSEIPHCIFWNTFLLRKCLSVIPRAPLIPTRSVFRFAEHNGKGLKALAFTIAEIPHCIFCITHFCLESGFLSFLELQKSLLVRYQGCWTQWQRFESSRIHHSWDTPTAFSAKHIFAEKVAFFHS